MISSISSLLPLSLSLLIIHAHPALSAYTTNSSALHDNSKQCSCYSISSGPSSNTPSYFLYHRFFDFRNLADGQAGKYTSPPPLITDSQDSGNETVTAPDVFESDEWTTDWGIQDWNKPATSDFPVRMVNSPANVYISQDPKSPKDPTTWLTLRTSRLKNFQSSAEIENMQKNVMYASLRTYARVRGDRGAVAGFFTFFDNKNESDIEILTRDPQDKIRYTNQPALDDAGDEVPMASLAVSKLKPWSDWQEHRIDWLQDQSFWYLDGKQVAKNKYSVPTISSYLVMNMWGDGGEWSGNMTVGASAVFEIQWVEMVFNTSGPVEGLDNGDGHGGNKRRKRGKGPEGCKVVCKIDGVKTEGTPEVSSWGLQKHVPWDLVVALGLLVVVAGGL